MFACHGLMLITCLNLGSDRYLLQGAGDASSKGESEILSTTFFNYPGKPELFSE